jgi:hypothetical protein
LLPDSNGRRIQIAWTTTPIAEGDGYRYYRLNITANNGDRTFMDLFKLGLFVSKP